ncbi:hypothetical protein ABZS66_25745 [Dactylosporangium sp. NPDC005572]|uniref:hypothetical protein n=1 Tax=Dactylosporangium sp. NPDC005572 TaxID=3156889 RepID=UPI0033A7CCC0
MVRWLWGARPFSVRSRLTVDAAVTALDADRATALTAIGLSSRGAGLWHVTGWVSEDGGALTSRRLGRQNLFRPQLRARFTPRADGCELTGSFAVPPPLQAFAAAWVLGFVVLFAVHGAFPAGLAAGLAVGALWLAAFSLMARLGRGDEEHLRRWVELRLSRR